jgi:preprotein translocase subunit SecG
MLLGILLTLLVIVCVLLIAVILMQRSEGGALGMGGGGGGGGFLSARGTGDLLTRTTQILGFIFFILCLTITVVTGRSQSGGSLINQAPIGKIDPNLLKRQAPAPQPAAPAGQPPADGFQAPAPSIGGTPATPAPAAPSPFEAPPAK